MKNQKSKEQLRVMYYTLALLPHVARYPCSFSFVGVEG
jgi:hypothetical protein